MNSAMWMGAVSLWAAHFYEDGLCVFYQQDNISRLPLAAHSMRELIEKCPTLTGRQKT